MLRVADGGTIGVVSVANVVSETSFPRLRSQGVLTRRLTKTS